MQLLLNFVAHLIDLYWYVVVGSVVMSWLIAFGVVNLQHPLVGSVWQFLRAATEPFLKPIRRLIPDMGGLDISPIILLLACSFIRYVVLGNLTQWFA